MLGLLVYFLVRDASEESGTPGTFYQPDNTTELCRTMELPWLDNAPDKSCIPPGEYEFIRHDSPEHPHTWELLNVPGRTGILIHNGNTEKDSLGCIVVGCETGEIDCLPAVLNSDKTLDMLRGELPDRGILHIS